MNGFYAFLLIVAAMAAAVILLELIIDVYFDWVDRRNYRRATHPENIEKNSQDILEFELQQFLLEERIKNRLESQRKHPASYTKPEHVKLDGETMEILAKLSNQRPSRRDRNKSFWWGE